MTDPRDLLPEQDLDRQAWSGIISRTVLNITDLTYVIIPDFDATLEWGPCRWQSRDTTSLPAKGDACLITFDNRRNPWVTAWWPF